MGGGVAAQSVAVGNATAALPTEGMRSGGPAAVMGIREGALWLVTARGLPFVVPMSHPGMHARAVAAHGDAAGACLLAEHGEGPATPYCLIFSMLEPSQCTNRIHAHDMLSSCGFH